MTVSTSQSEPQLEDFGITEQDLTRAPEPRLMRVRPHAVMALLVATTAAAFVGLLIVGDSTSAALFFAIILVAAWSIVLMPVFVCLVCASECLERRWLCRKFPLLDACLAYRVAVEEHRSRQTRRNHKRADLDRWSALPPVVFRLEIERQLEAGGSAARRVRNPRSAGYDFEADTDGEHVLIRCVPGKRPAEIAVGRELMSCLDETDADRAVLVSAVGAAPDLAAYVRGRPLSVVDPVRLSI
jgi:hypothetical protein